MFSISLANVLDRSLASFEHATKTSYTVKRKKRVQEKTERKTYISLLLMPRKIEIRESRVGKEETILRLIYFFPFFPATKNIKLFKYSAKGQSHLWRFLVGHKAR